MNRNQECNLELLGQMDEVKAHFLSLISHELRTPLSTIKAYTETLINDFVETKEEVKEFLKIILMECDNLAQQINDIIMMTSLHSQPSFLTRRLLCPTAVIKEIIHSSVERPNLDLSTELDKMAMEKGVTICLDLLQELPKIWADYKKIKVALGHLIENGIKFTPAGGTVTITARMINKNNLRISVSDTGPGIAEEDYHKIFMPFYQLSNPLNREVRGIGLGLTLVKYIIQSHSGQIWVESQIGQGSTFTVTLPCKP